jgi:hypothetical protein
MADQQASRRRQRVSCDYVALLLIAFGVSSDAHAAVTTLISNGLPSNRVDVVFLGDGYTQSSLDGGIYDAHIQSYVDYLFTSPTYLNDPFDRYAKFFNVHKADVVSAQSGADKPSQGVFVNTALDATYETSGVDRLLTINNSKANTARNQALAGTGVMADMQYVVVNDTKYGGAGGSWAVFAGGNSSAREIALHEVAHSFSNLADEYSDLTGTYSGAEPSEPNATKSATGDKWSRWAGFEDPRGSNLDIGSYVGAKRYPSGLYRPSSNSKMRTLGEPFDAVSRETIILDIYDFVNPLDGWMANSAPIANQPLWVDLIDPAVQGVEWFVDGILFPDATDSTFFDASLFGFAPGTYSVRARAYDRVLDHFGDGSLFDLVRKDLAELEQSVAWSLLLTSPLAGDFNGSGSVDAEDLNAWRVNVGLEDTAHAAAGDADGDRDVDGNDFLVWQQNLTVGDSTGIATVPEPGASVLLLAAALCVGPFYLGRRFLPCAYSGC